MTVPPEDNLLVHVVTIANSSNISSKHKGSLQEEHIKRPTGENLTQETETIIAETILDQSDSQSSKVLSRKIMKEVQSKRILEDTLKRITPYSIMENVSDTDEDSSGSIANWNLVQEQNVYDTLFKDDHLNVGEFLEDTACPYMGIRKFNNYTQNSEQSGDKVSCTLHMPTSKECNRAAKEYEINKKTLRCAQDPKQELCWIIESWRTSPETELEIKCDLSPCKGHPVSVTGIHPLEGVVDKEKEEHHFVTEKGLESFLAHFVIVNTLRGFSFCFLRCKTGAMQYFSQLLTFPPIIEMDTTGFLSHKDPNLFNINVIVLDSVSRAHFYRSLPKAVRTLRDIVYNDSINATALDFKLLQSSAPYTFHNIRAFMSGKSDFDYVEHANGTYEIQVLYKKFKNQGYYTLLQEDSCWFDEWGSLFTNNVFQNKTPSNLEAFTRRWTWFQDFVSGYNIDDFGLSHASCEVFKQYNVTNQFNQPRRICFAGKVFSEHFLDYSLGIFQGYIDSQRRQPIFSYTHLSPGHEVTGTRIKQIDEALSGYLFSIAHEEDTFTIIFSDHGPKTTRYSFETMDGRAEIYDSLLFMIVPEKVANILGMRRMSALLQNQNRLLTTVDLHNAIMSIGDPQRAMSGSFVLEGVFSEIPADRTCADISIKPSAVCKCEGWDQRYPDNDRQFTYLAEFALGQLNNNIQQSFLENSDVKGGFGKCQRLVGHSFEKIRRRKVEKRYVLTMDLIVLPSKEIFEVQINYPDRRVKYNNVPMLVNSRRVSIYRRYEKCVDDNVPVELCVCDSKSVGRKINRKNSWKWFEILRGSEVLETVFRANSFGTSSQVKTLHDPCLLLVTRKREQLGVAFEVANACSKRKYKVRLTGKGRGKTILSRKLPVSIILLPNTIHFVMSVHYLKKPFGFYLKTSFVAYNLEQ